MLRDGQTLTFSDVKFHTKDNDGTKVLMLDFYVNPIPKNVGTLITKSFQDTVSTVRMVWYSLAGLVTGKFERHGGASRRGKRYWRSCFARIAAELWNSHQQYFIYDDDYHGQFGRSESASFPGVGRRQVGISPGGSRRRKPVNPKYEGWVNAAGFVL